MHRLRKITTAVLVGATLIGCLNLAKRRVYASNHVSNSQINKYIKNASLRDKIGQMFIIRTPQGLGQAENDAVKYNLGGYIIYDADLQHFSQKQFKAKLNNYQKAASIPLLFGIDQEGGTVSRLTHSGFIKQNGDQFKFPREQYENAEKSQEGSGMTAVANYAKENATLLHDLGINWNFAPDADYSNNTQSFIYQRGFGGVMGAKSYSGVASYIKKVVPAWQYNNYVAATLKHFPGYGDATDTHTGFAHINKSKSAILKQDALPFKAGIAAGVDSVMTTHVIYNKIDSKYPASLSKKINNLLRKNFKFNGVIVTDALEMGAIQDFAKKNHTNVDVLAVKAGNDMLIANDYKSGITAIEKAVKKKQISENQIDNSVKRILTMKNKLHLLSADNLNTKQKKDRLFNLNTVKYSQVNATISGKAEKDTKVQLVDAVTKETIKTVKADKKGKFQLRVPLAKKYQDCVLQASGFVSVNVFLKASTHNSDSNQIGDYTLKRVSYNKKRTMATISGNIPDAGSEGSLTITFNDTKSGQIVANTVVGKNGNFSVEIPILKKARKIKVVPQSDDYSPKVITIAGK